MVAVRKEIRLANLTTDLPWDGHSTPFGQNTEQQHHGIADPTFIDDYAHGLIDKNPSTVVAKLTVVAAVVHDEVAKHGLRLNYKPSKTAAIIRLKGKGAPKLGDKTNRGNHYVTLKVRIPSSLSPREKEIVEELRTLMVE